MPKNQPTKRQREIVLKYIQEPYSQIATMKKLGLGTNYNAFNAIVHRVVLLEYKLGRLKPVNH